MPTASRRVRSIALLTGFVAAFLVTGTGILRAVEASGVAYRAVPLDVVPFLRAKLERIGAVDPRDPRVAFLGDSTSLHGYRPAVAPAIQRLVRAEFGVSPRLRVISLAAEALTPFAYYSISHELAEARPDLVVIAVNLSSFSPHWRSLQRSELAGWIPAKRWPEALGLPLEAVDVSADRLVLSGLLFGAGGAEAWRRLAREQVRVANAWRWAMGRVQLRSGVPDGIRRQERYLELRREAAGTSGRRRWARRRLGAALAGIPADDPSLRFLDAALSVFERAGTAALVYVAPINVESLRELAVYEPEGLLRTVEEIRSVAVSRGAGFIDLHQLLPDSAFRDQAGHLRADAEPKGAHEIAARLVPLLVRTLREASGAGSGRGS